MLSLFMSHALMTRRSPTTFSVMTIRRTDRTIRLAKASAMDGFVACSTVQKIFKGSGVASELFKHMDMVSLSNEMKKAELMPGLGKNCNSAMPVTVDGKISGDLLKLYLITLPIMERKHPTNSGSAGRSIQMYGCLGTCGRFRPIFAEMASLPQRMGGEGLGWRLVEQYRECVHDSPPSQGGRMSGTTLTA